MSDPHPIPQVAGSAELTGVSIIIPTYNRAELLRRALYSVLAMQIPSGCDLEVLVIDNNCSDHTPEVVDSFCGSPFAVRRISEQKQGLNHARNRGLLEAAFEDVIYLDDDMIVAPGWLEAYAIARQMLAADCVVGPVEPEYEDPAFRALPIELIDSVSSSYSRKGAEMHVLERARSHELPGCNFAVRKSLALRLGGFHPHLDRSGTHMLSGGDWEFGTRLADSGHRVVYAPGCAIRHLVSRTKTSRQGLRARWLGSGVTRKAIAKIRGEQLPLQRRFRLAARMCRWWLAAKWLRILNRPQESLLKEMQALEIFGMLFVKPSALLVPINSPLK